MAGDGLKGWDISASSNEGNVGIPSGAGPEQSGGLRGWDVTPSTEKAWIAGQNTAGTQNAYSNEWYSKWLPAYKQAIDEGTAGTYFLDHKDGIALQSMKGKNSSGQDAEVRVGDLYENGEYLGNVYDKYGRETASQIMAPLLLKGSEQAMAQSPAALADMVDSKLAESDRSYAAQDTQRAYNERVNEIKDENKDSNWLLIAGSIVGGAVTGAGAGSLIAPGLGTAVGAGGGALAGLVGGLMNIDQLEDQAARNQAKQEQAEKFGTPAALAQQLQGIGEVAQQMTNPIGNILHGAADMALPGQTVGDEKVGFYERAEDGSLLRDAGGLGAAWTVGDIAAGFVQGVGQSATMPGALLYQGQLGAMILGKGAGFAATGWRTFDDRTGAYDEVFVGENGTFDPAGFAAIGDIMIDVAQLGLARGLMSSAGRAGRSLASGNDNAMAAAVKASDRAMGQWTGLLGGKGERIAGAKFTTETVDGVTRATGHRLTFNALAPSEFIQYLSARTTAALSKQTPGVITSDDIYRAALQLEKGLKLYPKAAVTAFGEGSEEGFQTILEAVQHNAAIDMGDVWSSFLQGAAAGAGVAVGSHAGVKSLSERQYAQYTLDQMQRKETPMKIEEWNALNPAQKQDLLAKSEALTKARTEATKGLMDGMAYEAVKSVEAIERRADAERAQSERELKKANRGEDMATTVSQAAWRTHDHEVQLSLNELLKRVQRSADTLTNMVSLVDDAQKAQLQSWLTSTSEVLEKVLADKQSYYASGITPDRQAAIIDDLNAWLKERWDLDPASTGGADMVKARSVSLLLARAPYDNITSAVLMLPKVSNDMSLRRSEDPKSSFYTRGQGDNELAITFGVTKGLGADFDGDKLLALYREILDDQAYMNKRIGMGVLGIGKNKVNIMERGSEQHVLQLIGDQLVGSDPVHASNAAAAIEQIIDQLRRRYDVSNGGFIDQEDDADPIDAFRRAMEIGSKSAKSDFLNNLISLWEPQLMDFGRRTGTNELFWINTMVQHVLQEHQLASSAASDPAIEGLMVSNTVRAIKPNSYMKSILVKWGATFVQTLWNGTSVGKMFRGWQELNYNPQRAAFEDLDETRKGIYSQMVLLYNRISSKMARPTLESVKMKTAAGRALDMLRELVNSEANEGSLALLQMAGVRVADVDVDSETTGFAQVALAQWLLRRVVNEERRLFAGSQGEAKEREWNRLLSLEGDEAMVELLGPLSMEELLGLEGSALGANLTVQQWVSWFSGLSDDQKKKVREGLKLHYSYNARNRRDGKHNLSFTVEDYTSGHISSFQALVDAMMGAANKRISVSADGRTVGGRIGKSSNRAGAALREGHQMIALRMAELRLDASDPKAWAKLFRQEPKLAKAYMNMLTDDVALYAIVPIPGKPDQVELAGWVYKVLAEKTSERMEMEFFRKTLLTQMLAERRFADGELRYAEINDRIVKRAFELAATDPALHSQLLLDLKQASTVEDFIGKMNTRYRGNEAPFTAWNRSTAEVDDSVGQGSLTPGDTGTDMRMSLTKFKAAAEDFARRSRTEESWELEENSLIDQLERELKQGGGKTVVYDALRARAEFVARSRPPMDEGSLLRVIAGLAYGLSGSTADKGKTRTFAEVLVNYAWSMVAPTAVSADRALISSVTAFDAGKVSDNPGWLNAGLPLMDSRGNTIAWNGLKIEDLPRLWKNPANRPLLRRMLTPTKMVHTEDGRVTEQFLYEPTLMNAVSKRVLQGTFFDADPEDLKEAAKANPSVKSIAAQSKMNYLINVAARSPKVANDLLRYLTQVMVLATSNRATPLGLEESVELTRNAMLEMADILKEAVTLSGVPGIKYDDINAEGKKVKRVGTMLDSVRAELKIEKREKALSALTSGLVKGSEEFTLLIDALYAAAVSETDFENVSSTLELPETLAYLDELQQVDAFRVLAKRYFPKAKAEGMSDAKWVANNEATLKEVMFYIRGNIGGVQLQLDRVGLTRIFDGQTATDPVSGLPRRVSAKDWRQAAAIVVANELVQQTTGGRGDKTLLSAQLHDGELDFVRFDPLAYFVYDQLLGPDSAILDGARELHAEFNYTHTAVSRDNFKARVMNSNTFSPKRIGTPNQAVSAHMRDVDEAIVAAQAVNGIAKAGSAPKLEENKQAATRYTYLEPPANSYSTAQWDGYQLRTGLRTTGPSGAVRNMSARELEGRFIRTIRVLRKTGKKDASGAPIMDEVVDNLITIPALRPGEYMLSDPAAAATGLIDLDSKKIEHAVDEVARLRDLKRSELVVQVEFLHPMDQPVSTDTENWANNVWFEGVVPAGAAHTVQSLVAAYWYIPGGRDPEASAFALGSSKHGTAAEYEARLVLARERKNAERDWQTKGFYRMLVAKTNLLLQHGRLGDGSSIDPAFFNALMKEIKLHTLVKSTDADGKVVILTSEQVLALEAAGQLGTLTNPRLVSLSDEALNALLLAEGVSSTVRHHTSLDTFSSDKTPSWNGLLTPERLAALPDLSKGKVQELFTIPEVARETLVTSQGGRPVTSKERTRHQALLLAQQHEADKIHELRRNTPGERDRIIETNKKLIGKKRPDIYRRVSASSVVAALGVPLISLDADLDAYMEKVLGDKMQKHVDTNPTKRVWRADFRTSQPGGTPGVKLGVEGLRNSGTRSAEWTAPGDIVILPLDTMEGSDPTPVLERSLEILMNQGAIIQLEALEQRSLLMQAARFLQAHGYQRSAGDKSTFIMADPDERPITLRALESQLVRTGPVDTTGVGLFFEDDEMASEENAARLQKAGKLFPVITSSSLIPTARYKDFAPPTAKQWRELRHRLNNRTLLMKMTERQIPKDALPHVKDEMMQTLSDALDRCISNLNRNGRYAPGQSIEVGDLIPLYNEKRNQLLFHRYGHEAPSDENLSRMLTENNSTAIASPVPDEGVKAYPGTIIQIRSDTLAGTSIILHTPLQELGNKTVANNLKTIGTIENDDFEFEFPEVFPGYPVVARVGRVDVQSKDSFGGSFDNWFNLVKWVGADFLDDAVQAVYGDFKNPAKQEEAREQLRQLFVELNLLVPKYNSDTILRLNRNRANTALLLKALPTSAALVDVSSSSEGLVKVIEAVRAAASSIDPTPQQSVLLGIATYLMWEGAEVEHILDSPGLGTAGSSWTREVPDLFLSFLNFAEPGGKLWQHILDTQINPRLAHKQAPEGFVGWAVVAKWGKGKSAGTGLRTVAVHSDPSLTKVGHLHAAVFASTGANPDLNSVADERKGSSGSSNQQRAVLSATSGATSVNAKPWGKLAKVMEFVTSKPAQDGNLLLETFSGLPTIPRQRIPFRANETMRKAMAENRKAMKPFRTGILKSKWEKREIASWTTKVAEARAAWGLEQGQEILIEYWIRQLSGIAVEHIDYNTALTWLSALQENHDNGRLPVFNGSVPQLSFIDLRILHAANDTKKPAFVLLDDPTDPTSRQRSLRDWMFTALGVGAGDNEFFDSAFRKATDGFRNTYIGEAVELEMLPVVGDREQNERLLDPRVEELLLSVDPKRRHLLQSETYLAVTRELSELFGDASGNFSWAGSPAAKSARGERAERLWTWRERGDLHKDTEHTYKGMRQKGVEYVKETTRQNALVRTMVNARAAMTLLNPLMYASAPLEAWVQTLTEDAANVVAGASTGLFSPLSKVEKQRISTLISAMGDDPVFKSEVYKEITWNDKLYNAGAVEVLTHKWARVGGKWQDPYYGMRSDTIARRYVTTVLRAFQATSTLHNIDALTLADHLSENRNWVRDNHPGIHKMGMASLKEMRNIKTTTLSLMFRHVTESLTTSPRFPVNFSSTLFLKLPFLFASYGFNKATQVLGLQFADQAIAALMQGRKVGVIGNASQKMLSAVTGVKYEPTGEEVYDFSDIIESVDLTQAFIKSGMTHTGLLALGMALGGLNLTGEDEEDRRRRRAARAQGVSYLYDPRDIVNDFRNADAIYLDNVPFLNMMFRLPTEDNASDTKARAMVHPNWILNQIVAPIMGMERMIDNGNPMELLWAVESAIGNLPLINSMRWDDAAQLYAEMVSAAADAEKTGNPIDMPEAYGFMVNGMLVLERLLLESSFANMLYVGVDKYDRDPWAQPDYTSEQNIRSNRLGLPQPTGALKEFQNEDDETQQGYVQRDWFDATMHGAVENRATLALLSELFTFGQGDWNRFDQVVKTRTIEKQPMTREMVMQFLSNEVKIDDARAVIRALWKGGASHEQLNLEGFYIPYDMRQQIEAELKAEIIEEAKASGLNDYRAEQRMWEIWRGPSTNPTVKGLGELLYDEEKLPLTQSTKYRQLNTTYIIGPDGKPWATAINRNLLLNWLGFNPVQVYNEGTVGGMAVDQRLNAVDEGRGINTGLRSLEKVDKESETPVDEQKDDQQGYQQGYQQYGQSGSGYSYGGGGGGGGSSKAGSSRLYAPPGQQVPYVNDEQMINTNTPIIRRASIRRERVESQKGRLKPWQ